MDDGGVGAGIRLRLFHPTGKERYRRDAMIF